MKILFLFFVFFSLLHIKGFVNSGYGVNGMAHVSPNAFKVSWPYWMSYIELIFGYFLVVLYLFHCVFNTFRTNEKEGRRVVRKSFSLLFHVIPNLVYQRGREQWQEFRSRGSRRGSSGGWLACSFTCCCLSPDTASGAISRLHESQKTRTLYLSIIAHHLFWKIANFVIMIFVIFVTSISPFFKRTSRLISQKEKHSK